MSGRDLFFAALGMVAGGALGSYLSDLTRPAK